MKNINNYIYILIFITTIYNAVANNYSIDITGIKINGKIINNYNNIVIDETDTIIFNYELNQNNHPTTAPFLYKLTLKNNDANSERTAGLKEILYCNLTQGEYIFEVSAFDLAGKWMSSNKIITFEVNNKIAKILKKMDTLETFKQSHDSVVTKLNKTINENEEWNNLSIIIIYSVVGISIIFFILFIAFLVKGRKNAKKVNSLTTTIDDNATKILALQTQLTRSCNIEEMEKLKYAIESINKQLENISELNESFKNEVNDVQDKASKLSNLQTTKNSFFGSIVKGINNPTETIKGLVELLRSYDFNATETNDIVNNIIVYTNKIIDNAENIKRLAEFEDDKITLHYDTIDIASIIDTAVNKNIIDADKKNIKIKTNINVDTEKIRADQQKLIIIMHNLINNAIKFNNENGKVNINVYQKNNAVYFEVSDNGIGIDTNELDNIYKNLSDEYNSDVTISSNSTIGLLTIKKYVDAHNGRLTVSSNINQGSTFSFSIPFDKK
jgi:signal transduction histidine kinase